MDHATPTMTYDIVVRSGEGKELDLGAISVDASADAATIKSTLGAMLSAIATELTKDAYDGPTAPMPWLDNVDLLEFTDSIPRKVAINAPVARCGALPARAFRARYPLGCVALVGHTGNHCTDPTIARRVERRATRLDECDTRSQ